MRSPHRSVIPRGLTLVETLAALSIAALVATAAAVLLVTTLRAFTQGTGSARVGRTRAAVMERLVRDFESAYLVPGREDLSLRIAPDPDDPDRMSAAAWAAKLTRDGPPHGFAEVRRVAYETDDVPGRDGRCLLRMDRPAVGDEPSDQVPWDVVLDRVEEFSLRMLGGDTATGDVSWNSASEGGLPEAVRVRIRAPGLGGQPLAFEIALPAADGRPTASPEAP